MTACRRKCHDCGHEADYADDVLPACACEKCGSADTRLKRKAATTPGLADGWAVKTPSGKLVLWTGSHANAIAVGTFLDSYADQIGERPTWSQLEDAGYRVVRVQMAEVNYETA